MLSSDCMALREAMIHIHGTWTTILQLVLMVPILGATFGVLLFELGYPTVSVYVCLWPTQRLSLGLLHAL
jgi:hypothetical protein